MDVVVGVAGVAVLCGDNEWGFDGDLMLPFANPVSFHTRNPGHGSFPHVPIRHLQPFVFGEEYEFQRPFLTRSS